MNDDLQGSLRRKDELIERLVLQTKFDREVLSEILDLTNPRSATPYLDMQMIRMKAQVALRQIASSGLLS